VLSLLIQNNNKKELKTKRKGIDKKKKRELRKVNSKKHEFLTKIIAEKEKKKK
jgi:hypothetical protein